MQNNVFITKIDQFIRFRDVTGVYRQNVTLGRLNLGFIYVKPGSSLQIEITGLHRVNHPSTGTPRLTHNQVTQFHTYAT
jgi:hypothetical protein